MPITINPNYVPELTITDDLNTDVIHAQSDYLTVPAVSDKFHSTLQNQYFYQSLGNSLNAELQNVVDLSNQLKVLYDPEFFDGSISNYLDRVHIENSFPEQFVSHLNDTGIVYQVSTPSGTSLATQTSVTFYINGSIYSTPTIVDDGMGSALTNAIISTYYAYDPITNPNVTPPVGEVSLIPLPQSNQFEVIAQYSKYPYAVNFKLTTTLVGGGIPSSINSSITQITNLIPSSVEQTQSFYKRSLYIQGFINQWRGSWSAYTLPIKSLGLSGTANIALKYFGGSTATSITEKLFKLLNIGYSTLDSSGNTISVPSPFVYVIPPVTSNQTSFFPLSVNVDGLQNIGNAKKQYLYWDKGYGWDQLPSIPLLSSPTNTNSGTTNINLYVSSSTSASSTISVSSVSNSQAGYIVIANNNLSVPTVYTSVSAFVSYLQSSLSFANRSLYGGWYAPGAGTQVQTLAITGSSTVSPGSVTVTVAGVSLVVTMTTNMSASSFATAVIGATQGGTGRLGSTGWTMNSSSNSLIVSGTFASTQSAVAISGIPSGFSPTGSTSFTIPTTDSSSITLFNISNNFYTLDTSVPLNSKGKWVLIDVSLDRVLNTKNSYSTYSALLDTGYLESVDFYSDYVGRAMDQLQIGAQLTLVTSKTGFFNGLQSVVTTPPVNNAIVGALQMSNYTHPNIKARFQVYPVASDYVSSNYTVSSLPVYIKLGTGTIPSTFLSNQNVYPTLQEDGITTGYSSAGTPTPGVFGAGLSTAYLNGTVSTPVIPYDLDSPLFYTSIGSNEYDTSSIPGFSIINTILHPRSVSLYPQTFSNVFTNSYNPITSSNPYAISYPTFLNFGFGPQNIAPQSLSGTYAVTGYSMLSLYINNSSLPLYSIGISTATVPRYNHQIAVYEDFNNTLNTYDGKTLYEVLTTNGYYQVLSTTTLADSYSTTGYAAIDNTYNDALTGYGGTSDINIFNLLPLNSQDRFPTLLSSMSQYYPFDELYYPAITAQTINVRSMSSNTTVYDQAINYVSGLYNATATTTPNNGSLISAKSPNIPSIYVITMTGSSLTSTLGSNLSLSVTTTYYSYNSSGGTTQQTTIDRSFGLTANDTLQSVATKIYTTYSTNTNRLWDIYESPILQEYRVTGLLATSAQQKVTINGTDIYFQSGTTPTTFVNNLITAYNISSVASSSAIAIAPSQTGSDYVLLPLGSSSSIFNLTPSGFTVTDNSKYAINITFIGSSNLMKYPNVINISGVTSGLALTSTSSIGSSGSGTIVVNLSSASALNAGSFIGYNGPSGKPFLSGGDNFIIPTTSTTCSTILDISNASWSSSSGGQVTLTFATQATIPFVAGQKVQVSGILISTGLSTPYNGVYTVVSATTSNMVYALPSNPGTYSSRGYIFSYVQLPTTTSPVSPIYNASNTAGVGVSFSFYHNYTSSALSQQYLISTENITATSGMNVKYLPSPERMDFYLSYAYSSSQTFTWSSYYPNYNAGLAITSNNGSNTLNWVSIPNALSYNIYWSNSSSVIYPKASGINSITQINTNTYTHSSISNDTQYFYTLTANLTSGETQPFGRVWGTPTSTNSFPQVSVSPLSEAMYLSWSSYTSGLTVASSYLIYYGSGTSPSSWSVINTVNTNYSLTVTDFNPYSVYIVAMKGMLPLATSNTIGTYPFTGLPVSSMKSAWYQYSMSWVPNREPTTYINGKNTMLPTNTLTATPVSLRGWRYNSGSSTATVSFNTMTSPFAVGQTIKVSGVTPSGYNGVFTILSIVINPISPFTNTYITYSLATNPGSNPSGGYVSLYTSYNTMSSWSFGTSSSTNPLTVLSSAKQNTVVSTASITNIAFYSRRLNQQDATNLFSIYANRKDMLVNSKDGSLVYTYVDSILGGVSLKLQWNPNGIARGFTYDQAKIKPSPATDNTYPYVVFSTLNGAVESLKLIGSSSPVAITELGVFDGNDNMLAYANFPPIIYNPNKYHLSLNLLISQNS